MNLALPFPSGGGNWREASPKEFFTPAQWQVVLRLLREHPDAEDRNKAMREYLLSLNRVELETRGLVPEFGAYWLSYHCNEILDAYEYQK